MERTRWSNMIKKIFLVFGFILILGVLYAFTEGTINASVTEAGTVGDPLVTKSYVDLKVNEVKTLVDTLSQSVTKLTAEVSKLAAGNNQGTTVKPETPSTGSTEIPQYVVVEVKAGQKIIGGASTEMILRGGAATAIANNAGDGLADLTGGSDLKQNVMVPLNHLVLVPRDDGRGMLCTALSWVMVRGTYTIVD